MRRALTLAISFAFVFSLILAVSPATSVAKAEVTQGSFVGSIVNICNGDVVTVQISYQFVVVSNGTGRINFQGVGIGEHTGIRLHYAQGSSLTFKPGVVQTFEVNYGLTKNGEGLITRVHEVYHATIIDGTVQVLLYKQEVSCS